MTLKVWCAGATGETPPPSHSHVKQRKRLAASRRFSPELCFLSHPFRRKGAGKAGCRLAPARLPCKNDAHARHRSDTGQPQHPAFPAQWFDGLCALSPETNSCLPPSPPRNSRTPPRLERRRFRKSLAVATTARTTRFRRTHSASSVVSVRAMLTRFVSPCTPHSVSTPLASTTARPAARDDVRPPLFVDQGGSRMRQIRNSVKANISICGS